MAGLVLQDPNMTQLMARDLPARVLAPCVPLTTVHYYKGWPLSASTTLCTDMLRPHPSSSFTLHKKAVLSAVPEVTLCCAEGGIFFSKLM